MTTFVANDGLSVNDLEQDEVEVNVDDLVHLKGSSDGVLNEKTDEASTSTSTAALRSRNSKGIVVTLTREQLRTLIQEKVTERIAASKNKQDGKINTTTTTTTSEYQHLVDGEKEPDEAEEEEDEWHSPFRESAYTLLYVESWQTLPFWYGLFFYLLQTFLIVVTLLGILNLDNPDNLLQIPSMVSLPVTISQALGFFLVPAYQSDLIDSIRKIQEGFHPELMNTHPGATHLSWTITCGMQFLAGVLLTIDTFVLTMQAKDLLWVVYNIVLMVFLSQIDLLGVAIAKWGFVTKNLQRHMETLSEDTKVKKRQDTGTKSRFQGPLYILFLIGLFTGYGILKQKQLSGYYLPNNLYVQFDDEYNAKLPYFSGILSSGNVRTSGYREYRDLDTQNILLGYCHAENAWGFSFANDPCNYFARSLPTLSYDVASTPDSHWEVLDGFNRLQPFVSITLDADDCDASVCKGTCDVQGLCRCPHDRFGYHCEFANVCPDFDIHGRYEPFPHATSDYWAISDEFQLLLNNATGEHVKVYDMPVYYSSKTYPANVIFFGGRRWILTSELGLFNLTKAREENPSRTYFPEKTREALQEGFHGHHMADYVPYFFSDPVDFETPEFKPTPGDLGWWTVREVEGSARHYEPDARIGTVLSCKTCLREHGGFCDSSGGYCNQTSGQCVCNEGYFGKTCEVQNACYEQDNPCSGHGVCDASSGVCRCNLPWYGKLCDVPYYCYEEYGQCQAGGTCNRVTAECECPDDPAIGGRACEMIQNCKDVGCSNGGLCGPDGHCTCRPPFHGILCDLVDTSQEDHFCSSDGDCTNGRCEKSTGICVCDDPAAYGTLCEHQYDCSASIHMSCLNGGTCNANSGLCECEAPYAGPDCSQVPDCAFDMDCDHGDTVESMLVGGNNTFCEIESGSCRNCKAGREGKLCEHTTHCGVVGCSDRGSCNRETGVCSCPSPYSGPNCNFVIRESLHKEVEQAIFDETFLQCGFPPFPTNTDGSALSACL